MKKDSMRMIELLLFVIVLVLLIVNQVQLYQLSQAINTLVPPKKAVDNSGPKDVAVDFYVMSYCPYGNQAEELLAQDYAIIGNKVSFNPHYVIYANYQGGGPNYCMDNGNYCSMHGIQELNQDIRELCVNKYMGIDSYFAFAEAMNAQCTASNADTCWQAVASGLNLDTAKIQQCETDEGLTLVAAEKTLNDQLGVQGSPTVFIYASGETPQQYSGARSVEGFLGGICSKFTQKPTECSTVVTETPVAASGNC
jgi:hypothetical protein